jgi:hypothetical protein
LQEILEAVQGDLRLGKEFCCIALREKERQIYKGKKNEEAYDAQMKRGSTKEMALEIPITKNEPRIVDEEHREFAPKKRIIPTVHSM